jgi:hypothetical protein
VKNLLKNVMKQLTIIRGKNNKNNIYLLFVIAFIFINSQELLKFFLLIN